MRRHLTTKGAGLPDRHLVAEFHERGHVPVFLSGEELEQLGHLRIRAELGHVGVEVAPFHLLLYRGFGNLTGGKNGGHVWLLLVQRAISGSEAGGRLTKVTETAGIFAMRSPSAPL